MVYLKKVFLVIQILIMATLILPANSISIRLRLYESYQNNVSEPAHVTSSFYLKKSSIKPDISSLEINTEKTKLKKIFKLREIDLIGAGNFILQDKKEKNSGDIVIVNNQKLTVRLTLLSLSKNQFRVEIIQGEEKSILKTEIILPQLKRTVLGFEDFQKKIYFLAFQRSGNQSVKITKNYNTINLRKPYIIYKLLPKYPASAKEQGLEGTVILEATTNPKGKIETVKIIKGKHELLDKAAVDAVKKWQFKTDDSQKGGIPWIFEIYCNFTLKKIQAATESKINISFHNKRIELKTGPVPIYPEEALRLGQGGMVSLGIVINKNGKVLSVDVISGDKVFHACCLEAIKKWEFKPYLRKGYRMYIKLITEIRFTIEK